MPVPALTAPLLDAGVAGQTIFSGIYTTRQANSAVFGNVLVGDVSTTGNILATGASTTIALKNLAPAAT